MNSGLEELNSLIKAEADVLLHEHGLMRVLDGYGKVFVGGSYFLDLMTWRDLDIYLANDKMNEETFFELGKKISLCINPSKMSYRNEFIGRTEHLPLGYYWGCYTAINSNAWKVDVWSISSEEFLKKQQDVIELITKINVQQRMIILKLKNSVYSHPLYRKKFFSIDIYNAVTKDNIYTDDDFRKWLLHNRAICL
ncbi:hypothetical protein J2T17_007820 [Paenibacillus mucilaginosus]|uniref:hypothetical protein n=1 Tax=Paenibacillus mucilaginosus TaxID=61624 RepID=UPI003D238D94